MATSASPWQTTVLGTLCDYHILAASIACPFLSYFATSELFEEHPAGIIESCLGGCCPCCGWMLRKRLRKKYGLHGSSVKDFFAHLCCPCISLARIYKEALIQVTIQAEQELQERNDAAKAMQQSLSSESSDVRTTELVISKRNELHPPTTSHLPLGIQEERTCVPITSSSISVPSEQTMRSTVDAAEHPEIDELDTKKATVLEMEPDLVPVVDRETVSEIQSTEAKDPLPLHREAD